MPTLLIADDHPLFRAALRGAADEAADDIQTCEAGTLDDVMATLETRADIDLVLLDLHMPGNHGLAGLAALRAQFPAVAVVLVSANEDPQIVRRALDHGAAGYIPKSAGLDEMRDAIRAVLGLEWVHGASVDPAEPTRAGFPPDTVPGRGHLDDLRQLGRIGYVRGIKTKLDEIEVKSPECGPFVSHMKSLVNDLALDDYMRTLEALDGHAG